MEKFFGHWKATGEVEGLDEFAKALQLKDEQKAAFTRCYDYEFTYTDGVLTTVVKSGDGPAMTTNSKLGEKFISKMPLMGDVEMCHKLEGDEIITTQEGKGFSQTLRTYIQDGLMKVETNNNGFKATIILRRA